MDVRKCPKPLPADVRKSIKTIVHVLVKNELCIRPEPRALKQWDKIVEAWIRDKTMPLYVRKSSKNRGVELIHRSKRRIIPADNGPAHWAMINALQGTCLSVAQIKDKIRNHEINVAMAQSRDESANCKHRARADRSLNEAGWSLRHIEDVKLRAAHGKKLTEVPIEEIENHFRRFVSPRNMFLIPKEYSGLGELEAMKAVFRKDDQEAAAVNQ